MKLRLIVKKKIATPSASAQKDIVLKYGLNISMQDKNNRILKLIGLKFFFKNIKKRIGIVVAKKI